MVYNYNTSSNQFPGGLCYAACKGRFEEAYQQVTGNSVSSSLPASSRSEYYGPRATFDAIFNVASGPHAGWQGIDQDVRGKGAAGAIANAGFGEIKNTEQIWNGELVPGAVMQAFPDQETADAVEEGDPSVMVGGHSFIFLGYQRDDDGEIIGLNIADQGYRPSISREGDTYTILFGANITVPVPNNGEEQGN